MVRPWDEWLIVWGYDINDAPPELDDEAAIQIVHNLIGDDTIPVTIRSTSLWGNNKMYATRYREGRVFCMGDAVHRHPPSNGLGSNTSVQDAYNLAWKLAFVLRGDAGPGLLDSFDAERAPIGEQIVLRANKSIDEFGPIFEALGFADTSDPEVMSARMRARADNTPAAARQRKQLREALELKDYEFNAHGVELGQRHRSRAVVTDGTPEPEYTRDPELSITTPPPGPAPGCRTAGSESTATASARTTSRARVASPCSPASPESCGPKRPTACRSSSGSRSPLSSSAPGANTPISTTTGRACAGLPRTAACW
jgi:2,4-dichlorophenol 6-monooxygenase